jgi:hypothetical protein
MGQCVSRPVREYDAAGSVVSGGSRIVGLVPELKGLVRRRVVLFWHDRAKTRAAYHVQLLPPYSIRRVACDYSIPLARVRTQESPKLLAFEGVCEQGFVYKAMLHSLRERGMQVYVLNLTWIKQAQNAGDYATEYQQYLYR